MSSLETETLMMTSTTIIIYVACGFVLILIHLDPQEVVTSHIHMKFLKPTPINIPSKEFRKIHLDSKFSDLKSSTDYNKPLPKKGSNT